ncbi:MAG TPA: LLM class flavin-dependent oxidoreductase [Solirubrobacterales bacterium]|nr:LLM class flavin-dependent oxidoreductase [Solirubrobacterales bacterium]
MALRIGIFMVPAADDHELTVAQAVAADQGGLDAVAIQDHPYQRRFLDTWTLLSYLAARTERVTLLPDVINLPLRLPTVLAKSAASLDRLSGGRVELGIGAGAFWEGVEAMGGPRRSPGESVAALEEAITVIKEFLRASGGVRLDGSHYRVAGAKPGPPPAHDVGVWVGAYGPRMLRLTGRLGDGWLPSVGGSYLDPADVPARQRTIDEAATRAGRDPSAIVRAANVGLGGDGGDWLDPDALARTASELGFELLLVSPRADDPVAFIRRLGEDVAPRARALVG